MIRSFAAALLSTFCTAGVVMTALLIVIVIPDNRDRVIELWTHYGPAILTVIQWVGSVASIIAIVSVVILTWLKFYRFFVGELSPRDPPR